MDLYNIRQIRALLSEHGFSFSKSMGQNFLTDRRVVERIIESAGVCGADLVIEIGPGMGVLTAAAAEKAGRVVAVETDRRLIPILEDMLAAYDNVQIVHADILKVDLPSLWERGDRPVGDGGRTAVGDGGQTAGGDGADGDAACSGFTGSDARLNGAPNGAPAGARAGVKVIGNLPYYITSPIIMRFLETAPAMDSMTLMVQKEVGERLRAAAGSAAYGAITAAVRYYCEVRHVMNVSREVFIPKPSIDSSVLQMNVRAEKPVSPRSEALLFSVIRAGFGQRRKTLRNALTGVDGLTRAETEQALAAAEIDPARRAETLDLDAFAAIADAVYAIREAGAREG
jgi:16S rRNA (adenine1518-N6/adenine1519-N6)-dimethyltransferase